jgi:hypothetical protein
VGTAFSLDRELEGMDLYLIEGLEGSFQVLTAKALYALCERFLPIRGTGHGDFETRAWPRRLLI